MFKQNKDEFALCLAGCLKKAGLTGAEIYQTFSLPEVSAAENAAEAFTQILKTAPTLAWELRRFTLFAWFSSALRYPADDLHFHDLCLAIYRNLSLDNIDDWVEAKQPKDALKWASEILRHNGVKQELIDKAISAMQLSEHVLTPMNKISTIQTLIFGCLLNLDAAAVQEAKYENADELELTRFQALIPADCVYPERLPINIFIGDYTKDAVIKFYSTNYIKNEKRTDNVKTRQKIN